MANPVSKVLSHELSWRANPHKLGPRDHKTIAAAIYSNMRAFNCRPCDCYHIFRRPGFKTSNAGNRTFLCFNEKFRKKCDLVARQLHISAIITIHSVFTTINILVLHFHQNIIITIHIIQYPWCVLSSECHHIRTCSPLALQLAPNYGLIAVLIIQAIDMSDPKGIDQLPEIV